MDQIDRRKFMQQAGLATAATGAIWAAPSVLGASTAFASVSNPAACGPAPVMSFVAGRTIANKTGGINNVGNGNGVAATGNNGWAFTAVGMTGSDLLGMFSNYGNAPGVTLDRFVVERNPGTPVANAKVTYAKSLGTLIGGRTYTFDFDAYLRNVNQYNEVMAVQVVSVPGNVVTTLATYTTGNATGIQILLAPDGTSKPYSTSFLVPADGSYTFQYVFTFTNPGSGNGVADDIAVTAPVVTCA